MPRKLIHEHRYFLSIFSIYIVAGAFSFLFYVQGKEILYVNEIHTPFSNIVFARITQLVEVSSLVILGLLLLCWRVKYLIVYLIDLLTVTIVVRTLKLAFFADRIRPALFFGPEHKLNFVQGVDILQYYSFPSGHTTAAFALCFLLAIYIKRTWASMVLLVVAMLVGISRIYLMEHFWIDVYFGSLLGILITLLVYIAVQKPLMHSERGFLNFSIYERYVKRNVK
jgi:membrane-associated phospholipid phosphatase